MWLVLRRPTAAIPWVLALLMARRVAKLAPNLPQCSIGVDHGRAGMIADDFGSGLGLETSFSKGAKIFRVSHHSMGIVAKEIRLHDVVHHGAAVFFWTASRLKELVSDITENLWAECRHGLGLRASGTRVKACGCPGEIGVRPGSRDLAGTGPGRLLPARGLEPAGRLIIHDRTEPPFPSAGRRGGSSPSGKARGRIAAGSGAVIPGPAAGASHRPASPVLS